MNRILETRKAAKLSQSTLSKSVGWSQVRWSNYEVSKRTPNVDDARVIIRAFLACGVDTSLDQLFPAAEEAEQVTPSN